MGCRGQYGDAEAWGGQASAFLSVLFGVVVAAELQLVQVQLELGDKVRVRVQGMVGLGGLLLFVGAENVLSDDADGVLGRGVVPGLVCLDSFLGGDGLLGGDGYNLINI